MGGITKEEINQMRDCHVREVKMLMTKNSKLQRRIEELEEENKILLSNHPLSEIEVNLQKHIIELRVENARLREALEEIARRDCASEPKEKAWRWVNEFVHIAKEALESGGK